MQRISTAKAKEVNSARKLQPQPKLNGVLNSYRTTVKTGLGLLQWRSEGGAGGGGPRAQALEGAPAQLIGSNFKKKIRPRQIIKVTSLQCQINLAAKVAYAMGPMLSRAPRSLWGSFFSFSC